MIPSPLLQKCPECGDWTCRECETGALGHDCAAASRPVAACGLCREPCCFECNHYRQCRDCDALLHVGCHLDSLQTAHPGLCAACAGLLPDPEPEPDRLQGVPVWADPSPNPRLRAWREGWRETGGLGWNWKRRQRAKPWKREAK